MSLKKYTSEFKYNFQLAIPVMIGHLGHVLVGLADNIMVGRLGAAPLAAVSLGNSFVFIAFSLGIGFSMAITPLIAEADGEKDSDKGRRLFQHGLILCSLLGISMFVLLVLANPLMEYMDQPPEVVELARPYLNIVALSMIPLMIFQAYKQFADGMSNTKYGMNATLMANVVNVVLNFFLIYGFWIFPRLELVGAAYGTLFARFAMVFFMIIILNSRSKFQPYFNWLKLKEISNELFKKIINLGFPTAMQMLFEVGVFTAAIWLAGTMGTIDQAANQIALNLSSMTFMIAVGLGVTATIRVGNQKGLRNFTELRRVSISIFLQVFIIEMVFALLFITFKNVLPEIYIDNESVVHTAASLLLIAGLFQLSDGVQVVVLGALRGLQDVRIPTYITFIAYWIVGFPICYILGKELGLGSQGIWVGLLAGLTVSAVLLLLRFNYLTNKLIENN
ncbi:MATE family efflux transporter [Lutimonas zeaxanthinifaciens]|uniref:MATE family efflux transporter n=1 Tax=Lutimonas zeaxanthinifaciens TaxID=3060215 RepID=UPI00265D30B1|nr:MATE family efflux transporter [Lutimonas sp. YSD2104]WKK65047.1 MATE family efflux transporter [Lutimonas sp. YSD2104]